MVIKTVRLLIVGGGISGLTLANLVRSSKNVKFQITIFESQPAINNHHSVGGGIGLWPPSQSVLKNIPGVQRAIDQVAYHMPPPSYRNASGKILAQAPADFGTRFPVQCLNRDHLLQSLLAEVKDKGDVEIVNGQKIDHYERKDEHVVVRVDGKEYEGDLLVACDGIHSKIRNNLMEELKLPPVNETDLGYTYFRANTEIPAGREQAWSAAFETWGEGQSKKYGRHDIRFGYVPLKPPHGFWFIAVKTQKGHPLLSPIKQVQVVGDDTKAFLKELVETWKPIRTDSGELIVDYKELIDSTDKILRTDIAKIDGVTTFPWSSQDKRVVLMGDAAHATAPNVAQGAGLSMEDAACLASKLDRVDYLQGISEYEQERKLRAKTVQKVADGIASVGQLENPLLKMIRNGVMRAATTLTPWLQQRLFEYAVSWSLGGSTASPYWQAPASSSADNTSSSLFGRVFPEASLLDEHVKDFKTSPTGGSGEGVVSIEKPSSVAKILGNLAGFPQDMSEQPFHAEVVNVSKDVQRWARAFGYNTPQQKTYTTTHSPYCGFDRQIYLSEGVGGVLDNVVRFIYDVKRRPSDGALEYKSQGMTLFNLKLPLPNALLPKSEWVEKPTEQGWDFDGKISLPVVGSLLHYYGHFQVDKPDLVKNKRLIIAGGSGMIGKEVCLEFIKKGYEVYCLSRSANTNMDLEGVKVRGIEEDWSDLIDKNTIILNLSGANPGASRWTPTVKADIAESRFHVIDTIERNIEKANEKPLKYLQASAAGFYGNAGDVLLTEHSDPVVGDDAGTKFRVEVCQDIEERATRAKCNVVNLRIGHVLSNTGGLLPYYRVAGFFGVNKLGMGNQLVPWVHIKDVAKAIEFIARSSEMVDGAVNITAPEPCSNSNLLKELRLIHWLPGVPVPKSVLKLVIGESSVILTDSEGVLPERLLEGGFDFDYHTVSEALHGLQ